MVNRIFSFHYGGGNKVKDVHCLWDASADITHCDLMFENRFSWKLN